MGWGGRDVLGADAAPRRRVTVYLAIGHERECLSFVVERPAASGPLTFAQRISRARLTPPPVQCDPRTPVERQERLLESYGLEPEIGPFADPPDAAPGDRAAVRRLNSRVRYAAQLAAAGLHDAAAKVRACRRTWRTWTCKNCNTLVRAFPIDPCGDRLCPLCAAQRAATHARRVAVRAEELADRAQEEGKPFALKLLTLTLENVPRLEKGTWAFLRESFARFLVLVEHVHPGAIRGGVRACEVTWSPDCGWHPHLHCLLDADFLPQADLSDAWFLATAGAGYVADIRAVKGSTPKAIRKAAKEIAKYATKVLEIETPEALLELRAAIPRVRLIDAWGTFRGALAAPSDDSEDEDKCPACEGTEFRVEERRLSGRALLDMHLTALALAYDSAGDSEPEPDPDLPLPRGAP